MQLKTFSARSSAAVLSKIRAEFGPEAVILETRQEDGLVYMTAALERHAPLPDANTDAPLPNARKKEALLSDIVEREASAEKKRKAAGAAVQTPPASTLTSGVLAPKNMAGRAYRSAAALTDEATCLPDSLLGQETPGSLQWQEEWSCIKAHLFALMKPGLRMDLLAPRQRLALEYLQGQGVEDEALLHLYTHLRDAPSENILAPLAELVPVRPWEHNEWPQRIHFIAGPFGAGKTSVAIRMALALHRETPGMRVCLINADATRGNGRLLLRHYCELTELDYHEASSTLELVAALNKAERAGYDRILVDLPGMAKDKRLASLLSDAGMDARCGQAEDAAAMHLTLPPQYSDREMRNMLERYSCKLSSSIIWTRLDEATCFGQMVNVGVTSRLPVSALSLGPGLRHSFTPARAIMLWRLLFKQELPRL